MGIKDRIKATPFLGKLAVSIFRFVFYRLPTHYPATAQTRDSVLNNLSFGVEYVYAADVPGDIAEFGTMSGETAAHLAATMVEVENSYHKPPRTLRLFDSFQGLPKIDSAVDKDSVHVRSGDWAPGACFVLTKDRLKFVLSRRISLERCQIYDGWYSETLKTLERDVKLALIHVDCDLYSSTMDALTPLFTGGHVSPGALILFDDWNANRASPDHGERKAWTELTAKFDIRFSDEGGYGHCGRKFIAHSYKGMPVAR